MFDQVILLTVINVIELWSNKDFSSFLKKFYNSQIRDRYRSHRSALMVTDYCLFVTNCVLEKMKKGFMKIFFF
jgi:hypothetical protein